MVRGLCAAFLLLAACKSDISVLEHEMAIFKVPHERVRVEEMEQDYARYRDQAEELNRELIALGQERERLYAEYDKLRGELAAQKRSAAEDQNELATMHSEQKKLQAKIDAERKRQAALTKELAELKARNRAWEAKKTGTKAPE